MKIDEILELAKKASMNSYSPYSNFAVGCVLLTDDDKYFLGCNVENISYGGAICAERTAIVKAVSEGYKNFKKLAIYINDETIGTPCGICRQFISEFVDDDFEIICSNDKDYKIFKFSEILPNRFKSQKL